MGEDFIQDVVFSIFAADFRGQIIQFAAKEVELLQLEQQGFERGRNRRMRCWHA